MWLDKAGGLEGGNGEVACRRNFEAVTSAGMGATRWLYCVVPRIIDRYHLSWPFLYSKAQRTRAAYISWFKQIVCIRVVSWVTKKVWFPKWTVTPKASPPWTLLDADVTDSVHNAYSSRRGRMPL